MEDIHKTPNDESSSEDWSKWQARLPKPLLYVIYLAITFCVIGKACANTRLLSALEDRYAYECINHEEQVLRTLSETKQLLTKRQLRIYVMESFDDSLFHSLKEDENIYIISAELVLACAEKKIVRFGLLKWTNFADVITSLGHSGTTKESSLVRSTFVFSGYLFCWWYSSWNTCKPLACVW